MTSTIHKLSTYKKVPANGLAIFSGLVSSHASVSSALSDNASGKMKLKKMCIDIVPLKPLKFGMYYCDNRFHAEQLQEQLKELLSTSGTVQHQVGFVIVTGEGSLFGKLDGSSKHSLSKLRVELPRKHHKGGQSSKRFERLTKLARADYVKQVAEQANKHFISQNVANISSLVLAGPADLKVVLSNSLFLDYRLKKLNIVILDVGYGFEQGFQEAIDLAAADLQELRFVRETKMLQQFMDAIAKDSRKIIYGIKESMHAVELNLVDKLVVYDDLDILRVTIKSKDSEQTEYMNPKQYLQAVEETQGEAIEYESELLIEWLTENYKAKNMSLDIVSNATPEGKQFAKGFGGLGGFLRFEMDSSAIDVTIEVADEDLSEYL